MIQHQELIVPFKKVDKEQIKMSLYLSSIFAFLIIATRLFFQNGISYYIGFCIQSILVILTTLILFSAPYTHFFLLKTPAAILNQDGLWVPKFGFIAWENIVKVGIFPIKGTPASMLGFYIKDSAALSPQALWGTKVAINLSKRTGYPHITLSNIDMDEDRIICFAQRFMHAMPKYKD